MITRNSFPAQNTLAFGKSRQEKDQERRANEITENQKEKESDPESFHKKQREKRKQNKMNWVQRQIAKAKNCIPGNK